MGRRKTLSLLAFASRSLSHDAIPVVLKGLTYFYGSQRDAPAVDKLSIEIPKGEIFALLGHNGAGKTTAISVLVGMLQATSYEEASVMGFDLDTQMDDVRRCIGSCPQFDVLFDDLSAREHLRIYAGIKGRDAAAVDDMLHRLDLPLTPQKSSTFSGGMKRRLSVGCALVGDPSVILLDEPSSGLDPVSRRQLWALLRGEREKGKTLILTTHFMEEADYLGDRIAIMSHGKLYCCDTSMALKQKYGIGYYLNFSKPERGEDTFKHEEAMNIISRHVRGVSLRQAPGGGASYILPIDQLDHFGDMLQEIDANLATIGAGSYGISMNSLEDVFLSIADQEARRTACSNSAEECNTTTLESGCLAESAFASATDNSSCVSRFLWQVMAIMFKKYLYLKRSKRLWFVGIVTPILLVAIGYAAIVPNWSNRHRAFVDPQQTEMPDMDHLEVVVASRNDTITEEMRRICDTLGRIYPAMRKGQHPDADPTLSCRYVKSMLEYRQGGYIDEHSLWFGVTSEQPAAIIWDAINITNKSAAYVLVSGTRDGPPVFAALMNFLIHAALTSAFQGRDLVYDFEVFKLLPPQKNATTAAPTAPPATTKQPNRSSTGDDYYIFPLGIFVAAAISAYAGSVALFVADEINRKIFHTLRMHGLTAAAYWTGTLLFDSLIGLVLIVALVLGAYARGVTQLQNSHIVFICLCVELLVISSLLFAFALILVLPSNLKQSTYLSAINSFILLTLSVPFMAYFWTKGDPSMPWRVCTPARALFQAFQTDQGTKIWQSDEGAMILASLCAWSLLPILVILHYSYTNDERCRSRGMSVERAAVQAGIVLDRDVVEEHERVLASINTNMVCTVNLNKVFRGTGCRSAEAKVAVCNATFGIRSGECFGLLGPNGAGKTTTVRAMLQEISPSDGSVHFPYANVSGTMFQDAVYRKARIGVCQQHDTLWDVLSAAEHMVVYLRIRLGPLYNTWEWQDYINNAVRKVNLEEAGPKAVEQFSGGMKRKLSVCIAMYTGARVMFLDEPSTGMDPHARRALWRSIQQALREDRCVLLTTHSMEEADAVCARIAIMTGGIMRCCGSSQHLKARFGEGYAIILNLENTPPPGTGAGTSASTPSAIGEGCEAQLDAEMTDKFGKDCEVVEVLGSQRRYKVPSLSSLSYAFNTLRDNRAAWGIASYAISQASSLEQIFVQFAGAAAMDEPAAEQLQE